MKRTIVILVAILALAALTVSASNYCKQKGCCWMGPECGMEPGCGMPIAKMLMNPEFVEKIGLTADQIGKLKKLHFDHQKKMIGFDANLKTLKLDLMNLMDGEKLDKNMIRQKVKEIGAVKMDMALEKLDMKLAASDILTKEQIEKMKKMVGECRGKGEMKGMDMPEGPKMMMKHKCMPGGGGMMGEGDMMMPPPDDDEESGEDVE